MDDRRAQEIVDSLGVIAVRHRGAPVWIEELRGDMAMVRYLQRGGRARVAIAELEEG